MVTVEDLVILGWHTFSASSSQRITAGVVHTFILGGAITTTLHDNLHKMLQCMMVMWYSRYDGNSSLRAKQNTHIPDMDNPQGLLDIIAIGNILECAQVLDRRSYKIPGVPLVEQSEMAMARWRYRKLAVVFAQQYSMAVGGQQISPLSIFRRSLIEFAAAIIIYKREQECQEPCCTAADVYQKVSMLFEANYPEFIPCLETMISNKVGSLIWTGPPITIQPNSAGKPTRQAAISTSLNFVDLKIYPESTPIGANNPPQPIFRPPTVE
jgi:hypothetical protein